MIDLDDVWDLIGCGFFLVCALIFVAALVSVLVFVVVAMYYGWAWLLG